jgi:hypothetical protein
VCEVVASPPPTMIDFNKRRRVFVVFFTSLSPLTVRWTGAVYKSSCPCRSRLQAPQIAYEAGTRFARAEYRLSDLEFLPACQATGGLYVSVD